MKGSFATRFVHQPHKVRSTCSKALTLLLKAPQLLCPAWPSGQTSGPNWETGPNTVDQWYTCECGTYSEADEKAFQLTFRPVQWEGLLRSTFPAWDQMRG